MVQVTFISRPTYMRSWSKIGRREPQLLLTIVGLTLRQICTSEPLKYTLVTRPSTRTRGCGYMRLGGRWGWGPWICQSYPMHMYHAHVHMYTHNSIPKPPTYNSIPNHPHTTVHSTQASFISAHGCKSQTPYMYGEQTSHCPILSTIVVRFGLDNIQGELPGEFTNSPGDFSLHP